MIIIISKKILSTTPASCYFIYEIYQQNRNQLCCVITKHNDKCIFSKTTKLWTLGNNNLKMFEWIKVKDKYFSRSPSHLNTGGRAREETLLRFGRHVDCSWFESALAIGGEPTDVMSGWNPQEFMDKVNPSHK